MLGTEESDLFGLSEGILRVGIGDESPPPSRPGNNREDSDGEI